MIPIPCGRCDRPAAFLVRDAFGAAAPCCGVCAEEEEIRIYPGERVDILPAARELRRPQQGPIASSTEAGRRCLACGRRCGSGADWPAILTVIGAWCSPCYCRLQREGGGDGVAAARRMGIGR